MFCNLILDVLGKCIQIYIYLLKAAFEETDFFVLLDDASEVGRLVEFGKNPGPLCCFRTAFRRFVVSTSTAAIIKSTA